MKQKNGVQMITLKYNDNTLKNNFIYRKWCEIQKITGKKS